MGDDAKLEPGFPLVLMLQVWGFLALFSSIARKQP